MLYAILEMSSSLGLQKMIAWKILECDFFKTKNIVKIIFGENKKIPRKTKFLIFYFHSQVRLRMQCLNQNCLFADTCFTYSNTITHFMIIILYISISMWVYTHIFLKYKYITFYCLDCTFLV